MIDDTFVSAVATQPLSAEAVCGQDARFDPRYESVKSEISKLESLVGEDVDWNVVRRLGCELLGTTSKDLTLASYITIASLHLGGPIALRDGLRLIDGLCRNFWQGLFPERARGRRSALAWLSERAEPMVAAMEIGNADEAAAVDESLTIITGLWEYVQPLLEEDPGLGGISRSLRERKKNLSNSAPASTNEGAAEPSSVSSPAASGGGGRTVVVEKKLETRADAYARLREIAEFLTKIEPHSPVPLLLRRAMAWGEKGFEEVLMELIAKDKETTRRVREILGIGDD